MVFEPEARITGNGLFILKDLSLPDEYAPLRGTTNLRLTANQHCNVTETALAFSPVPLPQPTGSRLSYRLPGSLLGKQTLSTSRKRRSQRPGRRFADGRTVADTGAH